MTYNLPHVGGVAFQDPSVLHACWFVPDIVKPTLHVYIATESVPSLVTLTIPLTGSLTASHCTE